MEGRFSCYIIFTEENECIKITHDQFKSVVQSFAEKIQILKELARISVQSTFKVDIRRNIIALMESTTEVRAKFPAFFNYNAKPKSVQEPEPVIEKTVEAPKQETTKESSEPVQAPDLKSSVDTLNSNILKTLYQMRVDFSNQVLETVRNKQQKCTEATSFLKRMRKEDNEAFEEHLQKVLKQENLGIKKVQYQTYIGGLDGDSREGWGICYSSGWGEWIYGFFKNDQRNGLIHVDRVDGRRMIGHYTDGNRDGYREKYYATGCFFTGNYKEGKRSGKGVYYHEDGDMYDGEWNENFKEGYGEFYYGVSKELESYCGAWKKDQYDGIGKLTYKDGSVMDGEWEKGQFWGEA